MEIAIEEVLKQGKIAQTSICYTGDMPRPQRDEVHAGLLRQSGPELEQRGAHIINIKDMAGLLKPMAAPKLIKALREAVGLPIHLHTHDTSGNGVAMYLMAAQAGVDVIDCALSSMAGLTSSPRSTRSSRPLSTILAALSCPSRRPRT